VAKLKTVAELQVRKASITPLNQPRPIQVRMRGGEVLAVRMAAGWVRVVEVRDRWRIDDRWWEEQPIQRMYLELLLDDHRTVTVFLDLLGKQWYEQQRTPEHREQWRTAEEETI